MIDRVTDGKALPTEVLNEIVAKTDGVPLFVEELTKTILESGLLRAESGSYGLASPIGLMAIPSTLQDSLMARIDRTGSVKQIAQIGAAIGREFSHRLLEAVSPLTGAALYDAMAQLLASELIYVRGAPPATTYVFKHALVQDTAYASLLRSRKQEIHANIARVLVENDIDEVEATPSIIARHYTGAGLTELAAQSWLAAAELALSRSAATEAGRHTAEGLTLTSILTPGPTKMSLELGLHVARANAYFTLKSYSSPETILALNDAMALISTGVGTELQKFSVLYGLCSAHHFAGRLHLALNLARQVVESADRQGDPTYKIVGCRLLGTMQFLTGQHIDALETLSRAPQRPSDLVRQKILSYRFGWDPDLAVQCYRLQTLFFIGRPDDAKYVSDLMQSELQSHSHPYTIATCRSFSQLWLNAFANNIEDCERYSSELLTYCIDHKVESIRLTASKSLAAARVMREPSRESIIELRYTIADSQRRNVRNYETFFLFRVAQASLLMNDIEGAETAILEAFAHVECGGEQHWLAELHRIVGQIALKKSNPDTASARASFIKAIDIAHLQGARMLELHATIDLAKLPHDTSLIDNPRSQLERALGAIKGGETLPVVRDGRALLAAIL